MKDLLKQFKALQVDRDELKSMCGNDLYNVKIIRPEIVKLTDVIQAIQKYMDKTITKKHLVDWVNVLWFTELYEYEVNSEDSISSVMSLLETLDEEGVSFTNEEFNAMIKALKKNEMCDI